MHVRSKFFGRGLVELWQFLFFLGACPLASTATVATFTKDLEGASLNSLNYKGLIAKPLVLRSAVHSCSMQIKCRL